MRERAQVMRANSAGCGASARVISASRSGAPRNPVCAASNAKAAELVGIKEGTVKFWAYVLCGLAAGIAGLIATADIKAADANNGGLYLELDAILAVTIGGTAITGGRFSLTGTVVGALLIQALTTTINTTGVSKDVTLVIKAFIVIAVCLLQGPRFWEMIRGNKAVTA